MSQSDIAAVMRCSKRNVSAAKRAIVDYALTVAVAVPSYTAVKNRMLAIRAADAKARAEVRPLAVPRDDEELVDRAKSAGRVSGAAAWRRKGGSDGC